MPNFRADFDVISSLVLQPGAEAAILCSSNPEIIIRNGPIGSSGHVERLKVQVVAAAESIDDVAHAFRILLAEKLDTLSFATHSMFRIEQCYRITEWEPNQQDRQFHARQRFDPLHPPEPNLLVGFVKSADDYHGGQYLFKHDYILPWCRAVQKSYL